MMTHGLVRWLFIFSLFIVSRVDAHPDESDDYVLFLARWAEAINLQDFDTIETLTARESDPYYGRADATVSIFNAEFRLENELLVAEPVVRNTDHGAIRVAHKLVLIKEDGNWRVRTVEQSDKPIPEEEKVLPENVLTREISFNLLDNSSQKSTSARVRITDDRGHYWPPQGHQKNVRVGWRQDVGGDVVLDGKEFAYVRSPFIADLPPGSYQIEVWKGLEFESATKNFLVDENAVPVAIRINRWKEMNRAGWYSGDTHTHFLNVDDALLEAQSESLNVIYILATKWRELITDAGKFAGGPSPVSTGDTLVVVNEEARHRWYGHVILHGISELVFPLSWGTPGEGVPGGFDYPTVSWLLDRAHEQGGVATWAHFPYPGGELAPSVSSGRLDSVDLITWTDPMQAGPVYRGIQLPSISERWYQFLNTGARLPVTGGTDKMFNIQVSGSVRTYAKIDGKFSYRSWLEAIVKGRTFVTTGPIIDLTVDGQELGSVIPAASGQALSVVARVATQPDTYPIDALELVVGGMVVKRVDNPENRDQLELSYKVLPRESTWIAARVRGSKYLPYQSWNQPHGIPPVAHTSPIYVDVDGAKVWNQTAADAIAQSIERSLDWIESEARFESEEQKSAVVEFFRQARDYYGVK